ncbi:MAG: threonine aldolase family protein, partial [Candidatus Bathyarchaeota archaeon]
MLEAITTAPLGDDVYGDDPTVNRREELAAKKMGKEQALLVTSGTQANLVSALSHTKQGEEVILEAHSHMYLYEVGGISAIGGLLPKPISGQMGILDPHDVENAIREQNIHYPESTLVVIENTHNMAGGTCWNSTQIRAIHEIAARHGLKIHMDGARVFNAAIALNVDVKELTKHVDSVMFCLSKGLSAPIGSMVAGTTDFIAKARKHRK